MDGVDDVDGSTDASGPSSAALVGWGMTLVAVGALILAGDLSRRVEGERPGLLVLGVIVLLFGWGLLTGGLVTMAQRVERLSRPHDAAPSPAREATSPR